MLRWGASSDAGSPAQAAHTGEPPGMGLITCNYPILLLCLYMSIYIYVLFCFVLFCFVLFCFVLFCFVLFCFVLFYFVLFCFVLFCFVLFCFFQKTLSKGRTLRRLVEVGGSGSAGSRALGPVPAAHTALAGSPGRHGTAPGLREEEKQSSL